MQRFFRRSFVLSLAFTMACVSPTESNPSSLHGTWMAAAENASPSGWYQRSLTFQATGSFTSEFRSFGTYQGQSRDELSGYVRTEGTYRAEGDRLLFQPTRLVSWDRFNGVNSPVQVSEPYPYGSVFDDARFERHGRQLTLHYTTYPADAPVPTVMVYALAR